MPRALFVLSLLVALLNGHWAAAQSPEPEPEPAPAPSAAEEPEQQPASPGTPASAPDAGTPAPQAPGTGVAESEQPAVEEPAMPAPPALEAAPVESQQAAAAPTAPGPPAASPQPAEAANSHPYHHAHPHDGEQKIKVGGHIQGWFIPYLGEDSRTADLDPGDAAGFRLRRARMKLGGHATERTVFGLQLELADQPSGRTGVLDAWIGWYVGPELQVRFGVQRVPYAGGDQLSSARLQLPDRPLAILSMADFRDMGVTLGGKALGGRLRYKAGVFNGSDGHFTLGDDNPGLLYAARVEGGIGDLGKSEADLSGGDLRLAVGVGSYNNKASTHDRLGLALDLRLKMMGLSFTLGHLHDVSTPIPVPTRSTDAVAEVVRSATYGQLGYMLMPARLEIAFRIELIDDNAALSDVGDATLFEAGLSYYLKKGRMKVQLAYRHRSELDAAPQAGIIVPELANDAVIVSSQVRF